MTGTNRPHGQSFADGIISYILKIEEFMKTKILIGLFIH